MTVNADIDGVPAGNGIYGQKNRTTTFHVGDSMISKVNMNTDQMRVFQQRQADPHDPDHDRRSSRSSPPAPASR